MNIRKLLSYASIAAKAGAAGSGALQTEESLRSGKARLLLIAADCSANTEKELLSAARVKNVPYRKIPVTGEELGKHIGKAKRSAIVITDGRLAAAMAAAADEEKATASMPFSE